jgi:hypothetical protein
LLLKKETKIMYVIAFRKRVYTSVKKKQKSCLYNLKKAEPKTLKHVRKMQAKM